jgi:acyl-coenzyme A synthetase/AMP-(fatty) acid ligase
MTGGTSVLAKGPILSPGEVRRMVRTDGVTSLRLTTSLFRLFVEEDLDCFTGLSCVIVGGERNPAAHAADFLRVHVGTELYNGYGPTESAMHATRHRIRPEDCTADDDVPLGTAVPGTEVVVLDEDLQPCADGQVGEVCIGGDGLALGYWDDEPRTRQAFVTVGDGPASRRIYRTGDRGLVDAGGLLRFRGRRDRQVKISGHRIEPAEIEQALGAHPGVAECVVVPVVAPDGSVSGLAAAYRASGGELSVASLRAHLHEHLPRFAHPGRYLEMPALPRTDTGKLDTQEVERLVNLTDTPVEVPS